jgi:UDP-3-O-[3-hydroxymyristoyl] glucosamine N-acyltransferase
LKTVAVSMGDSRFFPYTGSHSLAAVADAIGCPTRGRDGWFSGVCSLELAGPDQVSFLGDRRYARTVEQTRAGAVIVHPDTLALVPEASAALVTDDPFAGWSRVVALFHPIRPVSASIHPSSVVSEAASVHPTSEVGAHAVIGAGAQIGARCWIGAGAVIGEGVVMGADCRVGPQSTISHAIIGSRVKIFPGARIGQEGFGFTVSGKGYLTTPQLCRVVLEDDVEVGANTTIDRGSWRDTVVGAGTRLDNLVHVAHNVRIGRQCAFAAHIGISGSVEIGDFVVMGGQAGVAEHVVIGARAKIGAQSGVMSEIPPGTIVLGSPARPRNEVLREIITLKKLAARKPL